MYMPLITNGIISDISLISINLNGKRSAFSNYSPKRIDNSVGR